MSNQAVYQISPRRLPAESILKAALHNWSDAGGRVARPCVTVSRQPGAGAITFSHRLAARLNETGEGDWSAWDRELVEKVCADHGIAAELIDQIEDRHVSWLDGLLESFSTSKVPTSVIDAKAYRRVTMTIRALAVSGHAVIVGRAGNLITRDLPQTIHLRLVSALDHRIKHIAKQEQITPHEAAERIEHLDRQRGEFYHRYWLGYDLSPDNFTLTLNSGEMTVDEMVDCASTIVRSREAKNSSSSSPVRSCCQRCALGMAGRQP